MTDQGK